MISVKNLSKTYFVTRTQTQEVLHGVDASFSGGEFVAVLGESGCGKSTFLNILSGLDSDYDGEVIVNGADLSQLSEKEMDGYRKSIGIVFQSYHLLPHMTAQENVEIAMAMSGVGAGERKSRAAQLLERVGLAGHADRYPNQLSGGQRQRAAVARSLANHPDIILADEPTGNLDKASAEDILALLKEFADEGKLVICVTHSERVASEATRVIRLDDGVIVSDDKYCQRVVRLGKNSYV
ncbi:MAG: ABC transporter ATP-binding protein [Firmicutes bacterium]|nr:ABC transporter ATP-binding protein [Bacillota bacterium]